MFDLAMTGNVQSHVTDPHRRKDFLDPTEIKDVITCKGQLAVAGASLQFCKQVLLRVSHERLENKKFLRRLIRGLGSFLIMCCA
jgi:hypothetical protein